MYTSASQPHGVGATIGVQATQPFAWFLLHNVLVKQPAQLVTSTQADAFVAHWYAPAHPLNHGNQAVAAAIHAWDWLEKCRNRCLPGLCRPVIRLLAAPAGAWHPAASVALSPDGGCGLKPALYASARSRNGAHWAGRTTCGRAMQRKRRVKLGEAGAGSVNSAATMAGGCSCCTADTERRTVQKVPAHTVSHLTRYVMGGAMHAKGSQKSQPETPVFQVSGMIRCLTQPHSCQASNMSPVFCVAEQHESCLLCG